MGLPPVMNIILFVLLIVSWFVLLGGVAALHDETDGFYSHDSSKRTYWWAVWLEFFVALLLIVSIIMGKIDEWKGVVVAFAAMASAYLMIFAESILSILDGRNVRFEEEYNCIAAGAVMVIICNWILIILYGNDSFRQMVESKAEALKGEPTA